MSIRRQLRFFVAGVGMSLLVLGLAPASASMANISHSYESSATIPVGSIVSLDATKSNYVDPANTDNGVRILGVAVDSSDSLLAVDPGEGTVQIATSGIASVLVSNVNGAVGVGDLVAVSPFDGVGMLSESGSHVIGLAQTALNPSASTSTVQTIKNKDGQNQKVTIGLVRVSISPGTAPSSGQNTGLNGLQKFVQSLTGNTISTVRIVISFGITIITIVALVTLMYGAIYSTIISVGRNPLAKAAVYRSLGSVLLIALIIGGVAAIIVSLLLH